MVYQWAKNLQSWLFPTTCLLCGAEGEINRDLCGGCRSELPYNTGACRRCAIPLDITADISLICGQCQGNPPAFDSAFTPFLYRPPMDFLLQELKFHGRLSVARLCGNLLGEALAHHNGPLPQGIIPVPLHLSRLRERGFNQALELARPVARRLGIPLLADHLRRARATPPQSQLDLKARRSNLRGAFIVTREIPIHHVAILDDIITSGSTVSELAEVLRDVGVEEITVWACARTPPFASTPRSG